MSPAPLINALISEFRQAALAEWEAWAMAFGQPWESPLRAALAQQPRFESEPIELTAAKQAYEHCRERTAEVRVRLIDALERQVGAHAPWWGFRERRAAAARRAEEMYQAAKSEWDTRRDAAWKLVKHSLKGEAQS